MANLVSTQYDLELEMETSFLAYQEGKPFSFWPGLINDVCLQFEKAEYVMTFNSSVPLSPLEMCYELFKDQGFLIVTNNKRLMKQTFNHHNRF
ncbi:hypothetical protein MKX03_007005, partial [Papaver bracteatum]